VRHHDDVDDSDWRLMGQEHWLAHRRLRWADWTPHQPGWGHDHCAFCFVEFSAMTSNENVLTAGYVTADDNYAWICPTCFEDFRQQFDWTIAPTAPQPKGR
jgi:hypothetical protein